MKNNLKALLNILIVVVLIIFFCFKGTYSINNITDEIEFDYTYDVDIENKIIKNLIVGTTVVEFLRGINSEILFLIVLY